MRIPLAAVLAALTAYGLWGVFPLYFRMLDAVEPSIIVAHRFVWSFLFLGLGLFLARKWDEIKTLFANKRALLGAGLAAFLLASNWVIYIWSIHEHRVLEASFGYFINPIVSVALGMVLLRERVGKLQGIAIILACVGIAFQAWALGSIPWLSLFLAATFAFYGYFRKIFALGAVNGLFLEVCTMLPLALAYLSYHVSQNGWGAQMEPHNLLLLALTGPITAFPLIAFGYAAKRLPLSMMGMLQYISPSLKFLVALFLFKEAASAKQLISFVIVWVALGIYSIASWPKDRNQGQAPEA